MSELENKTVSDGELADRYLSIAVFDGKTYEMEDVDGEDEYMKTDLRTGEEFTVTAAQYNFYARLGVSFLIGMRVTDSEFEEVKRRVLSLSEDERVAFGKENAMAPPERLEQ